MRIISGGLKGKSLDFLKNSFTRPLKDSVKENIFNILKHSNLINFNIKGAKILDLYSGIGSFGIECISRGATEVTFIEKDKKAFETLKRNLIKLSVIKKVNLFNDNIENSLKSLSNKKFNLIFFDPPFSDQTFINNIIYIKKKKMIELGSLIIIHRACKAKDNIDALINIILTRKYGRSKIIFGLLI